MAALLLTWNPDISDDRDDSWFCDIVRELPQGAMDFNWSTGARTGGVDINTRVFLFRVGRDQGIVASGCTKSEIYPDAHWDPVKADAGQEANFVDWSMDWAVDIASRIDVETLIDRVPHAPWRNLMGSGVLLQGDTADQLLALWAQLVAE